jgi:SagB-type dehydrogenase family enzyme
MSTLSQADAAEARSRLVGNRSLFSISELYHENSKITAGAPGIAQSAESVRVAPSGFKRYVFSPNTALPPPAAEAGSILSAISSRRSCREYSGLPLTLQAMSTLLFHASGTPDGGYRRCLPSAGGLYPLELYAVATDVEGLASGLYHYDVRAHRLVQLHQGDLRADLAQAVFIEEAVQTASAVFVLTGVFGRSKIKYGERAYRFVLLEAGHAMQNICLTATVLGLGACPVGGFVDDKINDLLNVDGIDEAAVYAATIGPPRRS